MSLRKTLRDMFTRGKTQEAEPLYAPLVKIDSTVKVHQIETQPLDKSSADIKLAVSSGEGEKGIEQAVKSLARAPAAVHSFQKVVYQPRGNLSDGQGMSFEEAHYDLNELARARDSESLINTSCERHVETALQQGFHWECDNEEILDYVNNRILEISIVSRITLRKVLEQILDQLATYGTAFLVVKRDPERSSGKRIKLFGKELEPIASWGVPDSATMKVAENKSGNIIGWKQQVSENGVLSGGVNKYRFFHPNDVFVFTRHKQAGRVFGRSMYLSSLDDAIMLRTLEDLVYVITQKHAFPIFQYIVGTKEHPATDTVLPNGELISEVELAQAVVENMPVEGGFVTSERHEVKLIGTEGKVLDLTPYIEHFRQRVQDSTRMSNAALGTGKGEQSKSTASTQIQNLVDSAKYLQDVVIDGMHWFALNLLAEGGYDINLENKISLSFSSSDNEENRARENHYTAQYQADLITHREARKALGRKELSEEDKPDTFSEKNHARDLDLARTAAAAKAASSASSGSKSSSNSMSSATRPSNQHGKKSTKTKVKKNDFMNDVMVAWAEARKLSLDHEPVTTEKSLGYNRAVSSVVDTMADISKKYLSTLIDEAAQDARTVANNPSAFVTISQRKLIFHSVRQAFKKHMSDTVSTGFKDGDKVWINAAFSSNKKKLEELAEAQMDFVYRAAYIAALNNSGVSQVKITDNESNQSVILDAQDYCSNMVQLLTDDHTIEAC